tara:strand:+ start:39 stop:374 length:336 start_codon:yes stop_codon:yes gene_type:complete
MNKLYKTAFFIYFSLITFLAFTPSSQAVMIFPHFDKLVHFGAFFVLFLLLDLAFKGTASFKALGVLILYGIAIESAQIFIPYRSGEMYDLLANASGLLVYFLFAPKFRVRT